MANTVSRRKASCSCGEASFELLGEPLVRAFCHCLICQEFNDADRADIAVFRGDDVVPNEESMTEFVVYKRPPLLRRGTCKFCGSPSIEKLDIPGMPKFTIVPTANLGGELASIEPKLHIFYHRRVADAHDGLPKYSGYLRSQLGFGVALVKAMLRGKR